jgi:hypothetical protein
MKIEFKKITKKDFKNLNEKDETLPYNFDEYSLELNDLLYEIPSIGKGIDYSTRDSEQVVVGSSAGAQNEKNMVDLSQALYHTSVLDESLLDISAQSYLDESSMSFQGQNENDRTVLEILNSNENTGENQIVDLWSKNKKEGGVEKSPGNGSLSSNSPTSTSPLGSKRKVKKYAIEPDAKCVKSFDEIKSKLAHSVRNFSEFD